MIAPTPMVYNGLSCESVDLWYHFPMALEREPHPEEIEASRDGLLASQRLDKYERFLALLRAARRLQLDAGGPDDLKEAISRAESHLAGLTAKAGGNLAARRRPRRRPEGQHALCKVFVDECGTHTIGSSEDFRAFVLAAVIIPMSKHDAMEEEWRQWKARILGSPRWRIHEPDVRNRKGVFSKAFVRESLRQELAKLDFQAVVCVMNRSEYRSRVGEKAWDESLPRNPYLMTFDFLMERTVMALETCFGGAKARVIAEARGAKEDAHLQYEYTRLMLDGTSYVSPAWFRQQLAPGIEFRTKEENVTGLQLADLIARPCGEKCLNPESVPPFWPECRGKLCQGQQTAHSPIGLKVFPWDNRYAGIWKS